MKISNLKVLSISAAIILSLAACNTEEVKQVEQKEKSVQAHGELHEQEQQQEQQHTDEPSHHEESETRYLVSSTDKVFILDGNFEQLKQFNIGQSAFTMASEGRYVFARDAVNNDSYTLIDSGIYAEDHGDHLHTYSKDPVIANTEIEANKPAHMISHAGRTAIFNDGSGKVDVFLNEDLSVDQLELDFYYEGLPHHGAAVPLSTGELAVTFIEKAGNALPNGVKVVDQAGQDKRIITNSCEGLHGTAYSGKGANEKLAFGCVGKVVLYNVANNESTDIIMPNSKARVSTVKHANGSDYFFTNYSVENEAQNQVGIINGKTAELKLVQLPSAYKSATLVTHDDIAYILAEDGNIYAVDMTTASIRLTISAFNPFNLDEEAPILFKANNSLFVSMPSFQKIYEVHGNHTHEVIKLDFEPTAILTIETN
ncbi:hypothetical protein ACTHOQ_06700 [Solibacillus silvestris]|uniref:hypothetical protein n=1 Tax=Solibacillus silvestris TaxID=76853 RepID=UPI003F7D973A